MNINENSLHGYKELSALKSRLEDAIKLKCSDGRIPKELLTILKDILDTLSSIENREFEWRNAFDGVHDPIFIHDKDYRIIRANTAYAQKAGMKIEDVIGKIYWEVFPKGDEPFSQSINLNETHNNSRQYKEVRLNNGDIYLSRGFAVKDSHGHFLYAVHIMEDITESRELQSALEESATRYKSLFEDAPDAIFLADAESGMLLDANPAAEKLTGRSRNEIITLHQSQLHPANSQAVEDFMSHVNAGLSKDIRPSSEIPVLHADGYEIMTEITARVFVLNGKSVIQGIFRNITERKQADAKLRETGNKLSLSLNLLKSVVESVPIRVFWKNRDLRYLGCNTLFAKDAGFSSPDDLTGKTDFDMSWKTQAELYCEDDRRVMESGISNLGYEEPQTTPDGKNIWLRTSKVPLRNDSQEVIGILGIYDDITAQKKTENNLLYSESRLKEAQALAHLGSWELDLIKNELWWSDENHHIFGIEPGERNTYETFLDTVHPEDREFVNQAYTESVEKRSPYDIEHRLLMADGSVKWVHERCKTFYADDGKPVRSAGTTLDITGRHMVDERLRQSEYGLAEAQRIAHLGNWELDIVNNVLTWSNEIYHIFGIEPQNFGASYEDFLASIHPDDLERVDHTYQESVKNKTTFDVTHRLLIPGRQIKYVRQMCETHYDRHDRPLRSLGTVQDITEQYLTAEELRHSNRALKALSSCNSILVHATNEDEILNSMCNVIIDEGNYRFAWIGMVEPDETKALRPVAHAGIECGYLEHIKVNYTEKEHGRGPAGCAVRQRKLQVVHDTQSDPNFLPWREKATECGFRSVLVLPLMNSDGQVFAVFGIYSEEAHAFDEAALKLLQELADDLAFGILSLRTRGERDHYLQEHLKSDERYKKMLVDTIRAMSLTVEKRDPYTAGHQNKVAQLSVAIGQELGMDEDRLEGLRLGATIHDIGKIYVPAEILNRPGRLTKAEFEIIKSHAEVGYDIIKDVHFPWPVADMVIQHHERMDGSGYPRGLKGDEIILEARILAVADAVEAITSHRPYRAAKGMDKAISVIEASRGTLYDDKIVEICLRLIRDEGFTFSEQPVE